MSELTLPPEHGIHAFLPSEARKCRLQGMSAQETINHLASLSYRRRVPQSEITQAVNLVFNTEIKTTDRPREPKPLGWQSKATERMHQEWKTTAQELVDMSDVHPKDIDQRALLECLFPDPHGLVCIGRNIHEFATGTLAEHQQLDQAQFIIPCFMMAREGITKAGKASCRAQAITGTRRFIVLDFDEPPSDQHPSIIYWLMEYRAPLLVIRSGGKSLHAWYATDTQDRDAKFWQLAIMAGADPALMRNHAQAVRMPMGTRDNGNHQAIVYFNPNNLPA
jgi:hypothetical protein